MGELAASVVVPTRNRAGRLAALLDSLAAQREVDFECIVVDDASDDETARLLAAGRPGLELRTLRHEEPRGPGGARNAGWRAARASLVAFVDDDCVAEPGWLATLVAAHRREPDGIVQGRTDKDPEELARAGVLWRSLYFDGPSPFMATCNLAYPRQLLERTGGFDESWEPFGEDTDLGWRALAAGGRHVYVDEARVRHAVHQVGLLGMLRDARRYVEVAHVLKQHPGFRRAALRRGVFLLGTSELLLPALAGLALARRTHGLSLAAALPYVLSYARHHRDPLRLVATLPAYLMIDTARVAALAAGSVKYRTFVL